MYGRVTRYYHNKNYGFIYGEDGNTYFIHGFRLQGEYPFRSDRSDYNAKNVAVIDAPERRHRHGNSHK